MKSSSFMSTEALVDQYRPQVEAGDCIVVAHHPSAEEGKIRLEFAQHRSLRSNSRRPMSRFERESSGFNLSVFRAWKTVPLAYAEELTVGESVSDLILRVIDSLTPEYKGQEPRMTRDGFLKLTSDGQPVYRSIVPCYTDEGYMDHIIDTVDSDVEFQAEDDEIIA